MQFVVHTYQHGAERWDDNRHVYGTEPHTNRYVRLSVFERSSEVKSWPFCPSILLFQGKTLDFWSMLLEIQWLLTSHLVHFQAKLRRLTQTRQKVAKVTPWRLFSRLFTATSKQRNAFIFLGIKRKNLRADYSSQSSDIKNKWSCTSAPPSAFMARTRISLLPPTIL